MLTRLVVSISHPAHVHYFKNFIREMRDNEHDILILAADKEVTYKLLNNYQLDYVKFGRHRSSLIKKAMDIPLSDLKLYRMGKKFNPDFFVGFGSIYASHASFLLRKNCIVLEDTEPSMEQIGLYLPFASAVCTPSCFRRDLGRKQIRYDGYTELTHLHPSYFKPDPSILDDLGLDVDEPFIVLRFVSWTASHDFGQSGVKDNEELVRELEKYGRVLISSERPLSRNLEEKRVKIAPEQLHNLLYYAALYVGEGGTTASEAAILGTHSIHISTLAKHCGVFEDLNRYGLMWTFDSERGVIEKVSEIMQEDPRKEGKRKRDRLIADKINVTAFLSWFVENYPESFETMRENPRYQERFKCG
jgi:predicted glycosyltransferase